MKRRDFLNITGSFSFLLPITFSFAQENTLSNNRHLVDTPEKRAAYLAKILKALCTDLGPHPAGSAEFDRAAEYVKKEMESSLPVVYFDEFTFDRWVLLDEPELYVGDRWVESYPNFETASTPKEGVSGTLRKNDQRGIPYSLVDSAGEVKAYFITRSRKNYRAVPVFAGSSVMRRTPTVTIGSFDIPLFESAVKDGTPVRLKAFSEFQAGTPTRNIIGTLPGESAEEIIIFAHADTVYTSPGANDNTACLAAMLMLAHAFSGIRPKKTISFVSTSCEENGCLGAAHYAERKKQDGTFNNIKYLINFDSPIWNTDFEVWSEDEDIQEMIQQIDRDLNVPGTPKKVFNTGFTLDNEPFRETGAKAIYAESDGPWKNVWHRPEDLPDEVRVETVEITYRIFHEYIKRIQDL